MLHSDSDIQELHGSFRDPSGKLFYHKRKLYRKIHTQYSRFYDHLKKSGLYDRLVSDEHLIPHKETDIFSRTTSDVYKVIQPEVIPFISYPYEWCFGQLKDAALATLQIQRNALQAGMSLKDASAYNMQFRRGKPILIDTLSFEIYQEGCPWIAYRQFCQHFLAPLLLMTRTDVRLNQLSRIYIDGIPLDLASRLLPKKTWLCFSALCHIHLHAKSQIHFSSAKAGNFAISTERKVSKVALDGILDSLDSAIRKLTWKPSSTEWGDYYGNTNYSHVAFENKKNIISKYLDEVQPVSVWDLGANTGLFSRIAVDRGINVVSFDIDPAAVEKNYRQVKENREKKLLPLCMDLTNPSPSIGWSNEERFSLIQRGPVDMVFALALIHHLTIGNNVPFNYIAAFLRRLCRFLVIEFVPKDDSQVQQLLHTREDIFVTYTPDHFDVAFGKYFTIIKCETIADTNRKLYLMKNKILNM